MPETTLTGIVPSTQALVALHVLQWASSESGLTEWEIEERIKSKVSRKGKPVWKPSRGTISKVVRGLLEGGYLEGQWVDQERNRRRPLSITAAGRRRLRTLLEDFRDPIDNGRRYFADLCREFYGRSG